MRRTLLILSVLLFSALGLACGERNTSVTNANANTSAGGSTGGASGNSGASSGIGPENQGIGGTSESNSSPASGNTYTVPPGFNKNGDRGSATSVGNSNTP
jgi:hypothetical protein